jgi:peroxiredoxin
MASAILRFVAYIAVSIGVYSMTLPCRAAETSAAPPRYQFISGQELNYRTVQSTAYHSKDRSSVIEDRYDITVWIVRGNPDGSSRLLIRERYQRSRTSGGTRHEDDLRTLIHYADLFPDGRELSNASFQFDYNLAFLFPPLPGNAAEAKTHWTGATQDLGFAFNRVKAAPGFIFNATIHTPFDKIFLDSHESRYTFDLERGLVSKSADTWRRDSGIKGDGRGTTELIEVKTMPPDAFKELCQDADRFFVASQAYSRQLAAASRADPKEAPKILAQALTDLTAAAGLLNQPDLKAELAERIKEHEPAAREALMLSSNRAARIGKPAPDFETSDMDGNKVRLKDLRGKVVVLDFWYRGCGACLRSMPEINQIAADFADQPVAIYGMNTDQDPADAQAVIHALSLSYPSLRARDLEKQFGVELFPTPIVIDRQGIVRDIHIGFSANLPQDLGRQSRQLLAPS